MRGLTSKAEGEQIKGAGVSRGAEGRGGCSRGKLVVEEKLRGA